MTDLQCKQFIFKYPTWGTFDLLVWKQTVPGASDGPVAQVLNMNRIVSSQLERNNLSIQIYYE